MMEGHRRTAGAALLLAVALLASPGVAFIPKSPRAVIRPLSRVPSLTTKPTQHCHIRRLPPQTYLLKQQQEWRLFAENKPASESTAVLKSLISASALIVLDIAFRRLLRSMSISFPSSLAGCGVLFASLLALPMGESLYQMLNPGSALLAKWLPVFFVPSLVTLPLADGLGSALEFAKVAVVIVGGFLFTLLTTAWSVLAVRRLVPNNSGADAPTETEKGDLSSSSSSSSEAAATSSTPAPPPFSDSLAAWLQWSTLATGAGAILASRASSSAAQVPLTNACMLLTTLCTFVFGARLPSRLTKVVHPLVTCTALTWLTAKTLGLAIHKSFYSMLKSYRTAAGSTTTTTILTVGAGDVLLFLLGPAVVSLACQMYSRRQLMRDNLLEVGTAVAVSSVGGLFGTAALVRLLDVGNPFVRLSLLSRNITSPLAMAIASILGADVSLAVSMVVVTGLIGANFGASLLDRSGVRDAVARGLGIGAAAHGLGTAAFAKEEDAFPFAAIAMALTASACTVLVSIPVIKRILIQLTLGV